MERFIKAAGQHANDVSFLVHTGDPYTLHVPVMNVADMP